MGDGFTIIYRPELSDLAWQRAEVASGAVARVGPSDWLAREYGPGARACDPFADFEATMLRELEAHAAAICEERGQ